jgi:hypothetical protein
MTAKDPDLSAFYALSNPKGRNRVCPIGIVREKLKPEEQAQLDAALQSNQGLISNVAIDKWLKDRVPEWKALGTWQAVCSHREERCNCV